MNKKIIDCNIHTVQAQTNKISMKKFSKPLCNYSIYIRRASIIVPYSLSSYYSFYTHYRQHTVSLIVVNNFVFNLLVLNFSVRVPSNKKLFSPLLDTSTRSHSVRLYWTKRLRIHRQSELDRNFISGFKIPMCTLVMNTEMVLIWRNMHACIRKVLIISLCKHGWIRIPFFRIRRQRAGVKHSRL